MKSHTLRTDLPGLLMRNKEEILYTHLPRLLKLVLALALLNTLAQTSWTLLGPLLKSSPSGNSAAGPAPAPPTAPSSEPKAQINLFGNEPVAPAAPAPVVAEPAPQISPISTLNATLQGIVHFATSPERALAIILDKNSNLESSYHSGEWLPENVAQVKEIHPDHVILEHQGKLETLRLPVDPSMGSLIGKPGHLASPTPQALPKEIRMGTFKPVAPPPAPPIPVTNAPPSVGKKMGELRKLLLDNPEEAMKLAQFEIMHEEGEFLGVRLFSGKDPGVFAPFGIQSGDIVTHINGIKLSGDPTQLADLYGQAGSMQAVTVRILRYGKDGRQPMMFNFPIAP